MKKLFSYMMVCGAMMTAVLGFTSCEDALDVQQAYPQHRTPQKKRVSIAVYPVAGI